VRDGMGTTGIFSRNTIRIRKKVSHLFIVICFFIIGLTIAYGYRAVATHATNNKASITNSNNPIPTSALDSTVRPNSSTLSTLSTNNNSTVVSSQASSDSKPPVNVTSTTVNVNGTNIPVPTNGTTSKTISTPTTTTQVHVNAQNSNNNHGLAATISTHTSNSRTHVMIHSNSITTTDPP